MRRALLPCLLAMGCSSQDLVFPKGFLWAVATSAHESEGRNTNSDWAAFEEQGNAPPAGWAQNSLELYDTDAANAKALNLNAFQLGIEWARVVPRKPADPFAPLTMADVDAEAVAHYHRVLDSIRSRGMTPIVAVTHFSFPRWVQNPKAYDEKTFSYTDGSLGGWASEDTAKAMARYGEFLAKEFGGEVHWWITLDEPLVALLAGFAAGNFPPGFVNLSLDSRNTPGQQTAFEIMKHMISAHAQTYKAMKAVRSDLQVGFAHNTVNWVPLHDPRDAAATERVHHAYNLLFLDAVVKGEFDTSYVGQGPNESHPEWAGTADYLGVNYYDSAWVVESKGFLSPLDAVPCSPAFKDALPELFASLGCPKDGPPEPPGMTKVLLGYQARYGMQQLITESGFIDTPEGKARKVVEILAAVHDAIRQGAQVVGYNYWTLNYDYEWNDGWEQDMGLYGIKGFEGKAGTMLPDGGAWFPDETTDFTRVPLKPITDVYGQIAKENAIAKTLLTKYGVQKAP